MIRPTLKSAPATVDGRRKNPKNPPPAPPVAAKVSVSIFFRTPGPPLSGMEQLTKLHGWESFRLKELHVPRSPVELTAGPTLRKRVLMPIVFDAQLAVQSENGLQSPTMQSAEHGLGAWHGAASTDGSMSGLSSCTLHAPPRYGG